MNKRFNEILNLAQSGQIVTALKKCDTAIKKKPKDLNLLLLAASLYAQSEQYEKVRDYCFRASRLDKKNINALYNLGVACMFLKDYESTIKYSLTLIKLDKNNAKAHANLGLAYWHTGELEKAMDSATTALNMDYTIATNHNNLGLIYKSLKDTDKALMYFKQAIEIDPRLAEAHYNYGITLLDNEDEQGNIYLEKALRIKPDYAEALNYKGLQLLEDDQIKQAIDHFKKAIACKQDYIEAYCNIGNAFMSEQEFKLAEAMYRKAIEYKPDYASAYNNLANALLDQDDFRQHLAEAEQCYLKAIDLAPELDDTYKNLAVCYQGEGTHEKALHYFKIYLERVPDDQVAIAGMASVHERSGEHDKAKALIDPYVNNSDVSADIVLAYAKIARHFKEEDNAINALIKIDDNNVLEKLVIEKYFALGKLTEAKGDIDTTFNYYKVANDHESEVYDFSKDQEMFDNLQSYFTKEKLQNLYHSENGSELPIFIVGMPRSGTSLAEQVLASHPDVYGAGELENMHNLVHKLASELKPKDDYPTCLDSMDADYANSLAKEHITALQEMSPKAKYIVDKMPHNFLGLGVINLLFPKANVIHCKRSSVDTCLSIYFQHFNKHHAYSSNLKALGQYYNLYADMMEYWKKVLDINIIELEYEKVIANPEYEMRNLLEQCNIDWNSACLKFHENKRTVMTPSYDQVRRPIYTSSVAKWKKYEHHLGELIDSLGKRAY
ncbi:MAG: sulfotransferase [Methylococcales bacterium]